MIPPGREDGETRWLPGTAVPHFKPPRFAGGILSRKKNDFVLDNAHGEDVIA
jgi:hypothetical protein